MRTATILATLLMLATAGCGGFIGTECPGITGTELEFLIDLAETDKRNGWTKSDQIRGCIFDCRSRECQRCCEAIIELVY